MPPLVTAEIIAVGSELLTPFRSDTNSLFLTLKLNELGIDVRSKTIAADDEAALEDILAHALSRTSLVITTGGLGPTADDVTRDAVSHLLKVDQHEDASIVARIQERFATRGLEMPDINRRQARVPRGATLLENARGTAPGLWIEHGGRIIVLLPGPPRELQPMFERLVMPRLAERTGARRLRRRVLKVTGRSESHVEEVAQPIYSRFESGPIHVETTILASPGLIELQVSAAGDDVDAIDRVLDDAVTALHAALGSIVFSVDGRNLEEVVGEQLRARGLKLAVAESCTGGLVGARLTDVPGSSQWFLGGIVAYDNAVKVGQLGVAAALIDAHGAVSEPVGEAMADGVCARLGSDLGVAVTGIAGPDGGTVAKPVGTVVVALAGPGRSVKTFRFVGDRQMIRQQAALAALDMVRRAMG